MPITDAVFQQGISWSEWLGRTGPHRDVWAQRYADAPDEALVAALRRTPEPRSIAALVDAGCIDCRGTIPYLARICDEAAHAAAIELRLFPVGDDPGIGAEARMHGPPATPAVVVLDESLRTVGHWGPRPIGARRLIVVRRARVIREQLESELDRWYLADRGASLIRELLPVLRNEPLEENRAMENLTRYLLHFAEADDE